MTTRNRFIGLILVCIVLVFSLVLAVSAFLNVSDELDERNKELNQVRVELDQGTRELNQAQAELAALTDYAKITSQEVLHRKSNISECVEPYKPLIRDVAVAAVANAPSGVQRDSESWKIWQINYWAAHNLSYVSDPRGFDYFALASETMLTRAGDCDDYAILIASMYESIGLDACIAFVDTDGDKIINHMTCLVYYSEGSGHFLDEEKAILDKSKLTSPTGKGVVANFEAAAFNILPKYESGIWIIIDPPFGLVKDMAGYVTYEEYHALKVIDVGS